MRNTWLKPEDAPAAIGPYSQAIETSSVVEVAGQIGLTPAGELVNGVAMQTRQALENIDAIFAAAGCGWEDVVKARLYLQDIGDYETVNTVYQEYVPEPFPARVVVAVAALPRDATMEVDVTAVT